MNKIANIKDKITLSFDNLKEKLGWKNKMQIIKIQKVILSVGVGKIRKDKRKLEVIQDRLKKITGQKPLPTKAKRPIAAYKLRAGEVIGYCVTLRGENMYAFLDKLINITLPRTKDFLGISKKSVDSMGNLNIGVREHTVFLETSDEEVMNVFGLCITVVSSAENKNDAIDFFAEVGFPFEKKPKIK